MRAGICKKHKFKFFEKEFLSIKEKSILSNTTKIKYVTIDNKLYQVKAISFYHMTMTLAPCNTPIDDVPADEVFPVEECRRDFHLTIEN